jgi:sporulation protein YlmC with PRC-barrel domain
VRLSEILGLPVRTESGRSLGRVHDVRAELTSSAPRVVGLCVGRAAVLERLGIGAPHGAERIRTHDVVDWRDVVRLDRRGIVVRDGVELT